MRISKFLHSCILVEQDGKRLLFDPGKFSFGEGLFSPVEIGAVDAILITHKHGDHYFPDVLKAFIGINPAMRIFGPEDVAEAAKNEGIICETAHGGDVLDIAGFNVRAIAAEHGPIPATPPQNSAYVVNDKLLITGDSFADSLREAVGCAVLALPVTAPWLRVIDALAFAKALKPKKVFPVHDAIMKDFMLSRIYEMSKMHLEQAGIEWCALTGKGESVEV